MKTRVQNIATTALLNPGTTVVASSWRAYSGHGDQVTVWHYSTRMADIMANDNQYATDYALGLGHSSVSDQNGMNQILRSLSIPITYRRDQRGGGPRYVDNDTTRRAASGLLPTG